MGFQKMEKEAESDVTELNQEEGFGGESHNF